MWHLPLKITIRGNINADCVTVFNDECRNEVETLSHKDKDTYKHFPKTQVVGVWKTKKNHDS